LTLALLEGSVNGIFSPMKFGREPEGSPTKIALVSRSIAVAAFCKHRTAIERGYGRRVMKVLQQELNDHMGAPYEEAFREYLWRQAGTGLLGDHVVAIGPWWRSGGQDQIDAVVLAQPELTRVPVAVGESEWSRSVSGPRIKAKLAAKAATLTESVDELRYIICARSTVTQADPETTVITASDIFPDRRDPS
jgi:hypothetical protein